MDKWPRGRRGQNYSSRMNQRRISCVLMLELQGPGRHFAWEYISLGTYTHTNVGALFVIPPPGLHRQINMLRRCMQQEFSFPFSSLAPPHCFF